MIEVGSILAGYRVDGVVGRGATATVYAATQLAGARRVAIKVLAPHLRSHAAVRERFREAALLQRALDQPNVLDVEDVVESAGELFIVMPLVGGGTLAKLISNGALTAERAVPILRQVADAIDFAHGVGVVHGDVKPRNVLIGENDAAYVGDFGLATVVAHAPSAASASPGTIDYSAPERLRGEPATPSADVYALACVLFECVTGVVPYPHDTPAAVVGGHLFDAPPRPSELLRGMPAELDEILASGLAKDPAERPSSAGELVAAAAAVLDQVGAAALLPPPRPEEPVATRPTGETPNDPVPLLPAAPAIETEDASRVSAWFWAAGALVVALAAIAGAWLGQRGSDEASTPPPSSRLAHEHDSAMRVLRVARTSGLESLRKATTGRGQARAATDIAVAYRTTSASVRRTRPPAIARGATDDLVRALDRAGVGFTRLARASRRGDEPAYAEARRMILGAEDAVRVAREQLRAHGY